VRGPYPAPHGAPGVMLPSRWLDAAERNGSVVAVREQVIFALLDDGKLDAGCDRAVNQ
jgi:hypothetical protein